MTNSMEFFYVFFKGSVNPKKFVYCVDFVFFLYPHIFISNWRSRNDFAKQWQLCTVLAANECKTCLPCIFYSFIRFFIRPATTTINFCVQLVFSASLGLLRPGHLNTWHCLWSGVSMQWGGAIDCLPGSWWRVCSPWTCHSWWVRRSPAVRWCYRLFTWFLVASV